MCNFIELSEIVNIYVPIQVKSQNIFSTHKGTLISLPRKYCQERNPILTSLTISYF